MSPPNLARVVPAIVIDPGHGGVNPFTGEYVTPGKRYVFRIDGFAAPMPIYEGERMRVLAAHLGRALHNAGFSIYSALTGSPMTGANVGRSLEPSLWPHDDVPLQRRVEITNSLARLKPVAPLLLSLHSNAVSATSEGAGQTQARGVSVWTTPGQTESDKAATATWEALRAFHAAGGGLPMRSQAAEDKDPDYESGFYVLRNTVGPAILVELGFHDHPDDAAWLLQDANLARAACTIAQGIAAWTLFR